jgi:hypothetical protein
MSFQHLSKSMSKWIGRSSGLVLALAMGLSSPCFAESHIGAEKSGKAVDNGPIAPADAQYTLYCQAVAGDQHVEQANAAKKQLVAMGSLKDWYIIHQEGESVIYYGFYRCIDDPKDRKETERAKGDLKKITEMMDQAGNKIFQHVLFVPVNEPDPTAPPEWNLLNSGGYWSVQIAAYKDSPKRKQAAVDAVREARKQGVQAYYYHGPTTSSVCIGAWPKEAVKDSNQGAVVAQDQVKDVLVLPQPLAEGQEIESTNRAGDKVSVIAPKTEIVDPSLSATMVQYPTNSVNGVVYVQKVKDQLTGEMKTVEDKSLLVPIPRQEVSLLRASQTPPSLIAPSRGPAKGTGTLKSIGN